jgi:anti-sigma regulatory factor (Ser/Thr protein kinase)
MVDGGLEAARAARYAIATRIPDLPRAVHEDVCLLVTELVTNAVLHGDGWGRPVRVGLRHDTDRLRVEVVGRGPGFEPSGSRNGHSGGDSSGGWGLILVDRIAERWGVRPAATGTCVWFEVAVAAAAPA